MSVKDPFSVYPVNLSPNSLSLLSSKLLFCCILSCLFFIGTGAGHAASKADSKSIASIPGSFTLEEAVNRAIEENFSIVAAQSGVQAAESWRKSRRGSFGPVLGTDYSYTHTEDADEDVYRWNVWLKQDVFSGFSTLAAYQKAALQKDNAEAQLAKARLALIQEVQNNFFLYLKAEENVRSSQDSLNRLKEQLRVTKSFYEVGLRPRLEVLQAEVNASEAEDTLLQAKNTVETQRVRLNTLLNLPINSAPKYAGSLEYIPKITTLDNCLEQAYKMRPDVMMANKSVEIAQKDENIAASGYYPKVTAEGRWSTQGDDWHAAGSDDKPTNYNQWSVGVNGSMNVFEWGSTYYGVQQAKHLVSKLNAEAEKLRQDVAFEVQTRLLNLDNATKRIKVARTGLEQAKEAYRVAAARYKSQVGTSLDVLDAHAKLTAAEVTLTGAQADYLSALADLYAAVGQENPSLREAGSK